MSGRSSSKHPDDRYLSNIWSISSRGTLYVGTQPGQPLPRGGRLTEPTRLGQVLEVKYTAKQVTPAGGKVPAFKLRVQPGPPPTTQSTSPVYAADKWWVVAEQNFDPFEHVPNWRTPQQLLTAYDVFATKPRSKAAKEGRWLKNYFAADAGLDESFSSAPALPQVVTTTAAARRRLELPETTPPAAPSAGPSGSFNVFGSAPPPSATATESMMLSQTSPGAVPPPPRGGIGMLCLIYGCSQ